MSNIIRELTSLEDFERVYSVFSGYPYYEKYTEQEVEEIFRGYQERGVIFGAYQNENCVGLIALERGVQEGHPVSFEEENVMYLADVAVLERYREKGLGTQLMLYGMMQSKQLEYDRLYMRTLQDESMSKPIALKVGFTQIPRLIQYVEKERVDGTVKRVPNIFLEIDLRNLNKDTLKQGLAMTRAEVTRKTEEKGMEIGE